MKKYRFSYYEFVKNFKSIEIYLDADVDPRAVANILPHIDELINWDEDGLVTDASEMMFTEIDSIDEIESEQLTTADQSCNGSEHSVQTSKTQIFISSGAK